LHIHTPTTNNNNAIVGICLTNTDTGTQGTNGLSLHSFRSDGYLWNYYNCNLIFGTSNVERVRIESSGNVGIGTNSAPVKLYVSGDIAATGEISAYYSDERMKNITSNIYNSVDIIDKLHGFYYHPNELAHRYGIMNTKQEIGLSAQNVQNVLPEIVKLAPFDIEKDKNGNHVSKSGNNYLTISYERLAPVFVEAIKELHSIIKTQNNEILLMKSKIENLESFLYKK
jgi:hypothetical protein